MKCSKALFVLPLTLLFLGCVSDSGTADAGESGETQAGDGDGDTGDGDGDTGDGDGDTGDGDGDTGDGDGDTGDGDGDGDDPLDAAACDAMLNGTPEPLVAALTAGEAATAPVVADGQTTYMITLPDGAAGFVELEIPDWETTQAFFTVPEIDYTVTVEDNSQVADPREVVALCPDAGITDQRIYFPHWTPATIEFSATGPRVVPLMIIRE